MWPLVLKGEHLKGPNPILFVRFNPRLFNMIQRSNEVIISSLQGVVKRPLRDSPLFLGTNVPGDAGGGAWRSW